MIHVPMSDMKHSQISRCIPRFRNFTVQESMGSLAPYRIRNKNCKVIQIATLFRYRKSIRREPLIHSTIRLNLPI